VFGTGRRPLDRLGENVPRYHSLPAEEVSTTRVQTHDVGGNGGNANSVSLSGSVVRILLVLLFSLHHLGYQVQPRLWKRGIHINAHRWDGTSCPPPP